MAAGAFDDSSVPAPEREIKNPPPNPHTDMYLVRRLSDIDLAQAKTLLLLEALRKEADAQSVKTQAIFDKVVATREEFVETNTKLKRVIEDCDKIDNKLDRVRIYVFGAAAVLAVISVIAPPLIARAWPVAPSTAATSGVEQPKAPKR